MQYVEAKYIQCLWSHVERTDVGVGALYLSYSLSIDDRLLEPFVLVCGGRIHMPVLSHVERTEVGVGALDLSLSLSIDDRLLEPYAVCGGRIHMPVLSHVEFQSFCQTMACVATELYSSVVARRMFSFCRICYK